MNTDQIRPEILHEKSVQSVYIRGCFSSPRFDTERTDDAVNLECHLAQAQAYLDFRFGKAITAPTTGLSCSAAP